MTWNPRETLSDADWALAAAARGQTPELMRDAERSRVQSTGVWMELVLVRLGA